MADTRARRSAALDPDALAALEEERDFLLRSLEDLEREYEADDVDDVDYAALKDDYTSRAAAVLRSIEQRRTAIATATSTRSIGHRVGWLCGILVVAVFAGFLIARASGARRDGDSATGDPLRDSRQLLADAQQAAVSGDYASSIALYTEALAKQPGSAEALTYRGWSKQRNGDSAGAATDIDAAIDLDPRYPDARVFRAIVFATEKRWDEAAAQLRVFDTLDAPPFMDQVISSQRLRERIALARLEPKLLVANPPSYLAAGFTSTEVFLASQQLDVEGRAKDELTLLDQLLAVDPKDVRALSYRAWVLARTGVQQNQQTVVAAAVKQFDDVVALSPEYPDVRVFRAFTLHYGLRRSADAKADLAVFDNLQTKPAALVALIAENNLRGAIDAALSAGK